MFSWKILPFISFSDIPKMIPPMTPHSVAIVKALPFTHPLIFSFVILAILEFFFSLKNSLYEEKFLQYRIFFNVLARTTFTLNKSMMIFQPSHSLVILVSTHKVSSNHYGPNIKFSWRFIICLLCVSPSPSHIICHLKRNTRLIKNKIVCILNL